MRIVVILTLAALVALVGALLTGSTTLAFGVVALAAAGIVLLVRDWRSDRAGDQHPGPAAPAAELRPDEFAPDISTDPGGPSSDARSDQVEGS